jgi:hypothetical protein
MENLQRLEASNVQVLAAGKRELNGLTLNEPVDWRIGLQMHIEQKWQRFTQILTEIAVLVKDDGGSQAQHLEKNGTMTGLTRSILSAANSL